MLDSDDKKVLKETPWPYNVIEIILQEAGNADMSARSFLEMMNHVLTPREQDVLRVRYSAGGKSLKSAGEIFGVTQERIRQIEAKAFRKLKGPHLREYIAVPYHEWKAEYDARIRAEEREKEANERLTLLLEKLPALEKKHAENEIDLAQAAKIHLEELDLSVRSYNCLRRYGMNNLQDILDIDSMEGMKRIRNLGIKSVMEIINKVHEYGYTFDWE